MHTDNLLDMGSQLTERGFLPQAGQAERAARTNITELASSVERAADSVLGSEADALRYAQKQLDDLTRQVEREINGGTNSSALAGGANGGAQNQSNRVSRAAGNPDGGQGTNGIAGANGRAAGNRGTNEVAGANGRTPGNESQTAGNNPQSQQRGEGNQPGEGQNGNRGQQPGQQPNGQGNGQQASAENQQNGQAGQGQANNGQRGGRGQQPNGQGNNGEQASADGQQNGQEGQGQAAAGNNGQRGNGQRGNRGGDQQQANNDSQQPGEQGQQQGGQQPGGQRGGGGQQVATGGGNTGGGGERLRQFTQQLGRGDRAANNGPITGNGFVNWSDQLRDVETVLDPADLRNQLATVRERVAAYRAGYRDRGEKPSEATVRQEILVPLTQVRVWLAEEAARKENASSLVPLDRDPVPETYSDLVRTYYEKLGSAK
jgi:hypothetical protein